MRDVKGWFRVRDGPRAGRTGKVRTDWRIGRWAALADRLAASFLGLGFGLRFNYAPAKATTGGGGGG